MKNWRGGGRVKYLVVSAVLSLLLVWGLAGSENIGIEPSDSYGDSIAGQDYAEVFSAGYSNSGIVYINWQEPQATNDFSCPAWFLAAYRFNDNDHSLVVELARGGSNGLTNNLRYAIHFEGRAGQPVPPSNSVEQPSLYLSLLTTNGVALAESDNLLTSSNVDHYVFITDDLGILVTNTVLLVNVPTAEYPDAAVIQIVGRHNPPASLCEALRAGMTATNESGPLLVHEALIFIDEGADGWNATDEVRNERSDYIFDASGGVISNYDDWFNGNNGGSSTNDSGGGSGGDGSGEEDEQQSNGTVWIDQALGNDSFSGFSPVVSGRGQGPKKTVNAGVALVGRAETLVIKSGDYHENLKIHGKNIRVVIEGDVKL